MDGIFTLPYSEYEVINQLQKRLSKYGVSCYIPTSRQQKGIDFIVHNYGANKYLRFQVKGSRSYVDIPKIQKNGKVLDVKYKYHLWFNNFIARYKEGNADYYALFGLYPVYSSGKNIRKRSEFWKPIILFFNEREMLQLLKKVKTKREKKEDKFFGFGFNDKSGVFGTRGFDLDKNLSRYLFDKQLPEIKKKLGVV